jgi:hypothetical protein
MALIGWLWISVAALAAFFVGVFLGGRAVSKQAQQQRSQLGLNMASDRDLALRTLRRELANYMVRLDPDRYLRLYREARTADLAICAADKATQEAELSVIAKKYSFYEDFDFVGTRDHVLYADVLNDYRLEEIEAHYLNIVKFHALKRALDEDWQTRSDATSDRDLEHLEKYVQQIKDTKLQQRLVAAYHDLLAYDWTTRYSDDCGPIVYETVALAVHLVPHYAETRYGFHFKDTNEFGLCGSFHDDNNKIYRSFYRSDPKFQTEIYLDCLNIEGSI